jgi:hypothetical protein
MHILQETVNPKQSPFGMILYIPPFLTVHTNQQHATLYQIPAKNSLAVPRDPVLCFLNYDGAIRMKTDLW